MKLLCLETATSAAAVSLVDESGVHGEVIASTDRHHTESLLPAATVLLAEAGWSLGDLDAVVVDIGPGLFTGLRVGVTTARSLAMAAGLGLIAVTSLEVLADDPVVTGADRVVSIVDARRGELFVQTFTGPAGDRRATDGPSIVTPEALLGLVGSLASAQPVVCVGDGALRHREALGGLGAVTLAEVAVPSPGVAGRLAMTRSLVDPVSVIPLYLRDPDAVVNFTVAHSTGS
jgi:tRNA threonylcarbamoyladenosine biosynthesis protein TsaB